MMPVLFEIGPLTVYSFGVVVFFGFIISSFLAFHRLKDENFEENDIFDLILFSGFFGFVFGRIFYVLFHWERFGPDFVKILSFGKYVGFSFWGVIFGIILGVCILSKKRGWNFALVADNLVIPLLSFSIFVQIGCFFNGCNLGVATKSPWGLMMPGMLQSRHPIFLYEAVAGLLILIYFVKIEKRWRSFRWYKSQKPGFLTLLYLSSFCFLQGALDFFREDKLYFKGLETSFLVPILLGLVLITLLYKTSERELIIDLKSIYGIGKKKQRRDSNRGEWKLSKKIKILKESHENNISQKDTFSN